MDNTTIKTNTTTFNTTTTRKARVASRVSAKIAEAKQIITSGEFVPNAVSARMSNQAISTVAVEPVKAWEVPAATAVPARKATRRGSVASRVSAKVAQAQQLSVSGTVTNMTGMKFTTR